MKTAEEIRKTFATPQEKIAFDSGLNYASQSKPLPTQEEVVKVLWDSKNEHDKMALNNFIEELGPPISRYKFQAAEIIKLFTTHDIQKQ